MSTALTPRATFRDVFAVREFRALWMSQILSVGGDRLALVALTLLVYDRTRSPLMAAVAYAAGYVPWVIGGLLLSGLADRLPRREVMVACDLVRAVLVAAMLVPRLPVAALVGLLFATTMFAPPFEAARASITPDILEGERYVLGTAVIQTTFRTGIVLGAAGAGVTVALIGARPALAVDAATFIVSGLIIRFGTRARGAVAAAAQGALARMRGGVQLVFGDRELRTLVLFGWLVTLYAIPEGIAAPYAARLGGGAVAAGLIIASGQFGAAVATPIFTRKVGPLRRVRWMGPMAVLACVTLVLTAFRPGLVVSLVIFTVAGTFGMYQIAANTAFVARVPNERRAQAFGLANAGVIVGQGIGFMAAGAAAEVVPPSAVIAVGGGIGALAACALALRWRQMSPRVGRHAARQVRGNAPLRRPVPVHARSR
ncbi:MAG: MFS transporter [Streptosporangiaceae bacterium]|nr:MFS transporter [Streptosporangiaceae bacterium]